MTNTLQFESPQVRVDNSVWMWLAKEKLDNLKLSTIPLRDKMSVSYEDIGISRRLVLSVADSVRERSEYKSVLVNTNTAKDFKELNRRVIFDDMQVDVHERFKPHVFVLSFADLKTYTFTFNVASPTLGPSDFDFEYRDVVKHPIESLESVDTSLSIIRASSAEPMPFSPSSIEDGDTLLVIDKNHSSLPFYLRSVLSSICTVTKQSIRINVHLKSCQTNVEYLDILIQHSEGFRVVPNWVRWTHPITNQPTTVQSVDLKRFMDPSWMATESVSLNIKLMKWRLLPNLNPEKMMNLGFLLIGAGTLGCSVARCLLSWGVRKITLVDSGKVSYSNPPRQWLFRLEDAATSAPKAETAAKRLLEILPSADIQGIDLSVPLPGHPADLAHLDSSFDTLKQLIASHDVTMMLTDSRESRWLPTLLTAASSEPKLGVSVALGFDSYLVKTQSYGTSVSSSCYFCNDVNAPTDLTLFRTLDQQCTVTRPGLAAIASCMAVELVASLSQDGFDRSRTSNDESVLGSCPDQIRGFLGSFQSFPAVTEPFSHCICCSDKILHAYREKGIEFIRDVIRDSDVLMQVSGLSEFNSKVAEDVIFLEDED
jgi:ubiquitin-like modifier-activating enzyme ATG7